MDPKKKARLVKALRSGKYKQGQAALRIAFEYDTAKGGFKRTKGSKFCCLGVACDISRKGKWEFVQQDGEAIYVVKGGDVMEERDATMLPWAVTQYFGLQEEDFDSTDGYGVCGPGFKLGKNAKGEDYFIRDTNFMDYASLIMLNDDGLTFN